MKPLAVSAASPVSDDQLVAAARAGSDEAFEALFRRYGDRITAHVRGMVYDSGRAEDIVQETFMSALRSLRATDREITFKPWIYQIARNGCIDHLRRTKRAEEISIDSDEFHPDFERRLSSSAPPVDALMLQRQDLDDLQQAFGGLPKSQYEILLLREFEGLSYQEIGRRMSLTPAAVESMLSRARRTLKGQFDEIATGERCRRMRPVMAAYSNGFAGKRDRRTLERHVRHCRTCRQEALAMGLDSLVVTGQPSRASRALSRAAALLPLPWILRRRVSDAADAPSASVPAAHGPLSQLSALGGVSADQTASLVQKAVALVAVAAVAGGGGIVAHKAGVGIPGLDSARNVPEAAAAEAAPPAGVAGDAANDARRAAARAQGGGGAVLPPALAGHPTTAPSPLAGALAPGSPAAGDPNGAAPGGPGDANAPISPGAAPPAGVAPTGALPPGLAPSKAKGGSKKPSASGGGPVSGGGSSGGGVVAPRIPSGVLHAPGLGGALPPGIQNRIDDASTTLPGNGNGNSSGSGTKTRGKAGSVVEQAPAIGTTL
jgi:RNA polymerase sigma factor (sigma-70 family)